MPRSATKKEDAPVISVQILEHVGVLSTARSKWTTELNLVSWDNRPAKYEIRSWSPDHSKMGKGVTFTLAELKALYELLANWNWDTINQNIQQA